MTERQIPGGQLAVGFNGRVLISKGFGMADREAGTPAEASTLFRIASVTKPLTAAATLALVEEGRLSLDGTLLEVLRPEIVLRRGREVDPRLKDVTIRHLLQHTGGWDRSKSGDPMFQSRRIARRLGIATPPAPADVIREVLGRPLDNPPGAHYAYSNFGYCLLGRIIERLGGGNYEKFVQDRVLAPAGIRGPRLGATLRRAGNEAKYYMAATAGNDALGTPVFPGLPDKVPAPYGAWCLESMDAHGGWIASAEDIVRFAMSLDAIGTTSPFRKRETWEILQAPPPGPPGHDAGGRPLPASYGCGFFVRRRNGRASLSHGGSLPGTTTYLWKRADGVSWAVFFNQREDSGPRDGAIVDPINKALDLARFSG
jgi:N-acyl-D-amino-acid deacylase